MKSWGGRPVRMSPVPIRKATGHGATDFGWVHDPLHSNRHLCASHPLKLARRARRSRNSRLSTLCLGTARLNEGRMVRPRRMGLRGSDQFAPFPEMAKGIGTPKLAVTIPLPTLEDTETRRSPRISASPPIRSPMSRVSASCPLSASSRRDTLASDTPAPLVVEANFHVPGSANDTSRPSGGS